VWPSISWQPRKIKTLHAATATVVTEAWRTALGSERLYLGRHCHQLRQLQAPHPCLPGAFSAHHQQHVNRLLLLCRKKCFPLASKCLRNISRHERGSQA
jgi:hypothetical protein